MVCAATKIAEVCIVLPLVHSRRTLYPPKSMKSLSNLNKNDWPTVVLGEPTSDLANINPGHAVDGSFNHYRVRQTVLKNQPRGAKNYICFNKRLKAIPDDCILLSSV